VNIFYVILTFLVLNIYRYQYLHTALIASDPDEKDCQNDFTPGEARRRFGYIKKFVLPVKFTYTGSKEHFVFLWKDDVSHTESEMLAKHMELYVEIRKQLPVHHTGAMRREVCLENKEMI
jgi:hypothetical protein